MTYRFFYQMAIWLIFYPAIVAATPPEIHLVSQNTQGLTLELNLPPFQLKTIEISIDQPCQQIQIPGWATNLRPGEPMLPTIGSLIQVPSQGSITVQKAYVTDGEYHYQSPVELCPVPGQIISETGDISFQFNKNKAAYNQAHFVPSILFKQGPREILRGVSVSRLQLFPFQWNPVTKELRYLNRIRLQIQFEEPLPEALNQTRSSGQKTSPAFENLLQKTIINYRGASYSLQSSLRRVRQEGSEPTDSEEEEQQAIRQIKPNDILRLEILAEGIYRLTYAQLVEAGLDPQLIDPKRLQLWYQGQEVAIKVVTQTADQFQQDDYIEFYAQGLNNIFTKTNVYWLHWRKKGLGKRIAQIDGQVSEQGQKVNAFYEQLHFEADRSPWVGTPGAPEQNYWFWERINALDVKEYTIQVPSVSTQPAEGLIRLRFQGRSTAQPHPNHHTLVKLNGTIIGDEFWDGDSEYIQEMPISSELLIEGDNLLTIEMPGDTGANVDVIYLDWIEISYWRHFVAIEDQLVLTINEPGQHQIEIKKLTQSEIKIYDITDPLTVSEVINFSVTGQKEEKDFQAIFERHIDSEKKYYVTSTKKIKSPSIINWQSNRLKSQKNGADYILITTEKFLPAVEPLGDFRRKQGLRVKLVSVEEIYNEFNEGLFHPEALKTFLKFAYDNWSPPAPTYVFLVGDARINYKDNRNKVPAYLSPSVEGLTPDDSYYVSVDGADILPDMLIGRIPGNKVETVEELVNKILRFEKSTRANPQKVLLVADSGDEFSNLNEQLAEFLPVGFNTDKIYLSSYFEGASREEREEKISEATQDIISSFNNGVMISNYIGHGVVTRWSGSKGLFKPENVHELTNEEQLAFALMLTCINGYFVGGQYSLAEEFILAQGGAIGAFAPSNVSYLWEDSILSKEIFTILFEQGYKTLGFITTQAKISGYERGTSSNAMKMFTLFGDPAIHLKDW